MSISTLVWLAIFFAIVLIWRQFLSWAQDRWFPIPPEVAQAQAAAREAQGTDGEAEPAPPVEDNRGLKLIGYGSFLMWRTQRGKRFLDDVANRWPNFWRRFADLGLVIVFGVMVLMKGLLIWQATLIPSIPKERAPSPKLLIGLPGLNPVIPLWYGILALAVAIIIHEFCHGFLARVAKVKVKTMGLLFFIFPIGAFVEPDEEQMMGMPRRERMRLYAAGPTSNIILAIILALVFSWGFMASLEPDEEGVLITSVSLARENEDEFPAERAGIEPWMLIIQVDDERITSTDDFSDYMKGTYAGQNITVTVIEEGHRKVFWNITLVDKGDYWLKYYPDDYEPEMAGQGFLGVATADPKEITDRLAHPLGKHEDTSRLRNFLLYITLPFAKLQPFPETFTELYQPAGLLGFMPEGLFWLAANITYWIFWLNLMVGLTNALPATPLDGGFIFADGLTGALERIKGTMLSQEQKENLVGNVTMVFSFSILFLLLFQIIGPRVIGSELEDFDAEFSISDDTVLVLDAITFDASSSEGDFDRYEWDFGDGETGTGERVDHSYGNPGRYIVVLTAYTDDGDKSIEGQAVTVNLEQTDAGTVNGGSTHSYDTDFFSQAKAGEVEVTLTETGTSLFASGTLTLEGPEGGQTSQDFSLNQDESDTFILGLPETGPGTYQFTIQVDVGLANQVDFDYTFSAQFG